MNRYRLTPAAQRDLADIWDFTCARWGTDQAETYLNEIGAAVERLSGDPRRGHPCDEIRTGYRRYGIGRHIVFYLSGDDGVVVVRILHQRMDPTLHPL